MTGEILNVLIIFGTLFGIIYIIVSSRTKVRLALVEKGEQASIFHSKSSGSSNIFPIILINISLLLMSVGVGIFMAAILHSAFNVDPEVAYPGAIFTVAGLGLFIGYLASSKIGKKVQES